MNKEEIEKEIKILNIDPVRLQKRVHALGGRELQNALTKIWWYDIVNITNHTPKNNEVPTVQEYVVTTALEKRRQCGAMFRDCGVYFRVREEGYGCDLTLKYKVSMHNQIVKNAEFSYEFTADKLGVVRNYVQVAGFECIAKHEKKRQSFSLKLPSAKVVQLDVDEWPGIPIYLEIESDDVGAIHEAIDILGLGDKMTTTSIGKELFQSYGIEFFSNLTFQD